MKYILFGLVALALLGKLQDETIGSITSPAFTVYNRLKPTKKLLAESNHLKDAYINVPQGPNSAFSPRWRLENIQNASFLPKELLSQEKIQAVKDWNTKGSEYLAIFSTKEDKSYLHIYRKSNILSEFAPLYIFQQDMNCPSQFPKMSFETYSTDDNKDGEVETWMSIHCKAYPKQQMVYILEKDKTYAFHSNEAQSIDNLPEHLRNRARGFMQP